MLKAQMKLTMRWKRIAVILHFLLHTYVRQEGFGKFQSFYVLFSTQMGIFSCNVSTNKYPWIVIKVRSSGFEHQPETRIAITAALIVKI